MKGIMSGRMGRRMRLIEREDKERQHRGWKGSLSEEQEAEQITLC
jgi:hypothetical protein